MNIQSLSIVVPTKNCWNKCEFCVSRMHHEDYGKSIIGENNNIPQQYLDRIAFVREEGCNTMILTGTGEPQQNLDFISKLLYKNFELPKPFYNIAIQTTGSGLTDYDIKELAISGVTTMAISTNSLDDEENWKISNTPEILRTMTTKELIAAAKKYDMNVRLCYNLTSTYNKYNFDYMMDYAVNNNVDQVTFRKIYTCGNSEIDEWIKAHAYDDYDFMLIKKYVTKYGKLIARLPYGFLQYSVNGVSVVVDDDCMAKDNIEDMKYAILRPNGHLYSRWDDKGSLIF